jgi:hypothetical protein
MTQTHKKQAKITLKHPIQLQKAVFYSLFLQSVTKKMDALR